MCLAILRIRKTEDSLTLPQLSVRGSRRLRAEVKRRDITFKSYALLRFGEPYVASRASTINPYAREPNDSEAFGTLPGRIFNEKIAKVE